MADKASLEAAVLQQLDQKGPIKESLAWMTARKAADQHEVLVGVLKSLVVTGHVAMKSIAHEELVLTEEGVKCAKAGSPEFQVYKLLSAAPMTRDALEAVLGKVVTNLGWSQCLKQKLATLQKDPVAGLVLGKAGAADEVATLLQAVAKGAKVDAKKVKDLSKRKLCKVNKYKTWSVAKGDSFSTQRKKAATDLTTDMLRGGKDSWKNEEFKEYNFEAKGSDQNCGSLHPLLKVRKEFRNILLEMGFEEMATNRFVENGFWNFDALFQPQQHPARDAHDTFFIKDPAMSFQFPKEYLERVRTMHEKGGHGSIGYRYDWAIEETQKNILRTHTTAVSSATLYKLAQAKPFKPARYFSIDRVFRNESLDATHLAEFHQVEGFIADYGLTLGDLIGVIHTFFKRIGIDEVRFKPAYNPYTEPSMEIFGYSKELAKWVEVGNSGIFRPEMLRPMGMPEGVNVIAWGLSLERPTMIKYGIDNIRDLFGPKVKLDIISKNPIARYD